MNPFLGTSVEAWFIWDAYLGGNAVGGFRIPLFLFSRRTSQREHVPHTLPLSKEAHLFIGGRNWRNLNT